MRILERLAWPGDGGKYWVAFYREDDGTLTLETTTIPKTTDWNMALNQLRDPPRVILARRVMP